MTDDKKISQRYRELSAEEPPRALDDAILAAARNVRISRQRWYAPLATAAVLALAVAVTLHMQLEQPGIESPVPQAPPPPAVVKDTAPEVAKEIPKIERKAKQPAPAATPEPKPFATDKSVASAPARDDLARSAAGSASGELARQADQGSLRKEAAEQAPMVQAVPAPPAAKPAPAPPAAAAPRAAARSLREQPAELSPDKELERIAELRKQERHEEADKALAEFRRRHPDYKISGAMLERVERR